MFSGLKKFSGNLAASYGIFKKSKYLLGIIDYYRFRINDGAYADDDHNPTHFQLFYNAFNKKDIKDKYLALVKGLDAQSRADVADIINGVIAVGAGGSAAVRIKQKRCDIHKQLKGELYDRILKLNDDVYVWDKYFLPLDYYEPSVFYYRNGIDYIDDLSYFADKNIIDAGGFIGDSVLILAPMTTGLVYSFEAASFNANLMQKTFELNNVNNALIVQAALGDTNGTIQIKGFFAGSSASTSSVELPTPSARDIDEKKGFCEDAKLVMLDKYVADNNLTNIGLIKMDIEGAEMAALKGSEQAIRKHRPTLVISIYHSPEDFFDIKPMLESWDLGYKFKIRHCPANLICETLLIAEVPPENR